MGTGTTELNEGAPENHAYGVLSKKEWREGEGNVTQGWADEWDYPTSWKLSSNGQTKGLSNPVITPDGLGRPGSSSLSCTCIISIPTR
jgi:hypothetical protein